MNKIIKRINVTQGFTIDASLDEEKALREILERQRNSKPVDTEGQPTFGAVHEYKKKLGRNLSSIDMEFAPPNVTLRHISPEEESHWRSRKAAMAYQRGGHVALPVLPAEKKEKAVNAFTYTAPAQLDVGEKKELLELTTYKTPSIVEPDGVVEKKRSVFVRYWREGLIAILVLFGAYAYYVATRPIEIEYHALDPRKM